MSKKIKDRIKRKEKIESFSIGDKFAVDGVPYLMFESKGLYYLVNMYTGNNWRIGLEYGQMIHNLNDYSFIKLENLNDVVKEYLKNTEVSNV